MGWAVASILERLKPRDATGESESERGCCVAKALARCGTINTKGEEGTDGNPMNSDTDIRRRDVFPRTRDCEQTSPCLAIASALSTSILIADPMPRRRSMSNADNVIILGAGASVDAGIPTLADFMDTMWQLATRGTHNGLPIPEPIVQDLRDAMQATIHLDKHHGRVQFDPWNIEDLLSLLHFDAFCQDEEAAQRRRSLVKAISHTIEITCDVDCDGRPGYDNTVTAENDSYAKFLKRLLRWVIENDGAAMPKIISLNYDLVLERSLFQVFNSTMPATIFPGSDGFAVNYHYLHAGQCLFKTSTTPVGEGKNVAVRLVDGEPAEYIPFDLMKLHGSLNFPASKADEAWHMASSIEDPLLIPPVASKELSEGMQPVWTAAHRALRNAKNIVFVGYSLPTTDAYMQFFLKAALGPNADLNQIIVYDPRLFKDNEENEQMRERFSECFSAPMQKRIIFEPQRPRDAPDPWKPSGTWYHFANAINDPRQCPLFS